MGGRLRPAIAPVHPRTLLEWVRAAGRNGKAGLVDGFARRGLARAGLHHLFTPAELALFGLDDTKKRWWIVVAIDCRTRVILGMRLTCEQRSSAAVGCLRMITSDKGGISDATGAVARWSQYGTPELLVAYNGSAFKATAFSDACADLRISLLYTIAGAPGMRGAIERMFQTCATNLLPRLSGRTFSDVVERADHPAEARACLGPEDLCFALVRWIVDIYHNTPHSELGGRTPLAQWEADHRAGNYPLRAAPDRRARRLAFGLTLKRRARREGVVILGVRYHSEALAQFVTRRGASTVDLRWDPEDIGVVEVSIDGQWQEVPAVHAGLDGLHVQLWIAGRRALGASDPRRKQWEEDTIAEAIEAIKAMNQHRSLQFQLIDKPRSERQIEALEGGLFDGFRVPATSPKLRSRGDGPDRSVVPVGPVEAGPADAVSEPRSAIQPPLERGDADEFWSFDE
jgi:putative transposase